jgi:O-antigen/teichoic acid export membrane protein
VRSIKVNIAANLGGGALSAVVAALVAPLQLRLLGPEAFGLIALMASLQVVVSVLDLGLTATITRSIAGRRPLDNGLSLRLAQTASTVSWSLAMLVAAVMLLGSAWISRVWLKPGMLSEPTVVLVIRLTAVFLGLRLPVALFHAILAGLQRLDLANLFKSGFLTVRIVGGSLLLFVRPDVRLYMVWCVVTAGFEIVTYAVTSRRLLPELRLSPRIYPRALSATTGFTVRVAAITLIAMLLTQSDKLMMSKLLPLGQLGYYSLAYSAAMALSLIPTAVTGAVLPAVVADIAEGRLAAVKVRYVRSVELIGFAAGLPTLILVFYGAEVMTFLAGVRAAEVAATSLRLLAVGFFLNGIAGSSYALALGAGRPDIPLRINAYAVGLYVPITYLMIESAGLVGAAAAWCALNIYYVLVFVPWTEREILGRQPGLGLMRGILRVCGGGLLVFAAGRLFLTLLRLDSFGSALWCAGASAFAYVIAGVVVMPVEVHRELGGMLLSLRARLRSGAGGARR